MANSHSDLRTKIDEEALNAGRTDQEVLDWLNETESLSAHIVAEKRWRDVEFEAFDDWVAGANLFGEIHNVAETTPSNDNSSCARMLDLVLEANGSGRGVLMSRANVRTILDNGTQPPVNNLIPAADRLTLDAIAQPQVFRWENADWSGGPILGDVVAARALP